MYLDLMKKFVHKNISGTKFSDQFFQTWKLDRDKIYNSKELVYTTEIDWFSFLISDLFLNCELFEGDPLLREAYEISKSFLNNSSLNSLN